MDNFTLLATLFIIAGVNMIFTFGTSQNAGSIVSKEWRRSSVLLFIAFSLMLTQASLPRFISILIANYIVLLGFYYQIYTVFCFEFKKPDRIKTYLPFISFLYAASFLYFTYIEFHTTYRIIVISVMLAIFYAYAAVRMKLYWRDNSNTPKVKEIYYLFVSASIFYVARVAVTITELGEVESLFDRNTMTTITFLYLILFNLVFLMSMFKATIREKNQAISREKQKFNHLFEFLSDTAKHLKLEDLYPSIESVLRKSFKVDTAAIFLKDEENKSHSIAYYFNELGLPLEKVTTFNQGEGLSGRAMVEDRVIIIDIDTYPDQQIANEYKAKGVTNMVGIPLKTAEGVIGAITVVYSTHLKEHDILDSDLFYYLGEQIGLVLQNALLYKKLIVLADTDPLTGLLNRRKMREVIALELNKANKKQTKFVAAIIDLDNFKKVNDTFGHECGDSVIKHTTKLFKSVCNKSDYVCRWGGEEFLCLFVDTDLNSARVIGERMRKAFEQQTYPCLEKANVTISIGLAEYNANMTMDQLIAHADLALYQAKRKGRNRVETNLVMGSG